VEQFEDFEAHDYSGADMNMFQGTRGCEYFSKNLLVIFLLFNDTVEHRFASIIK